MKKFVSKLISVCPSGGCTSSLAPGHSSRSISRRTMAGVMVSSPATSAGARQTTPMFSDTPDRSVVRVSTYQVPGAPLSVRQIRSSRVQLSPGLQRVLRL